jgi:NADPH2:quinone reductase
LEPIDAKEERDEHACTTGLPHDLVQIVLDRNFGFAWGGGGWLLWPLLQKIGPDAAAKLRARIAAELKTTFASHYAKEISLAETLDPAEIAVYGRRTTGAKYLINPAKASTA